MERWERELGLAPLKRQEREPTELELLLQKWEQAGEAALSPEPEGMELLSREPEGVGLPPREPEEVGLPSREPEGVELPSREPEEVRELPPPQPRSPTLETSPVLPGMIPYPLLLDTLPVCLDLPLFAASLPLGDRTSLRRSPGEDLCPLLQSPVSRPSLQSALSSRWVSRVAGSRYLPGSATHFLGSQELCYQTALSTCSKSLMKPW
ncbi:UNVERIFIED_CONTAM: hypothetical protein FKN15_054318 [Acipenser sinensis]